MPPNRDEDGAFCRFSDDILPVFQSLLYMSKTILTLLLALAVVSARAQSGVETERKYLSGHGCDDMVQWDFY